MYLHLPIKREQSGFSVVEVSLVILVVAVLAVSGFVVYQRHKSTSAKNSVETNPSQTTSQQKINTSIKTNAPVQVTPTAFVNGLLGTLSSNDENQFEQLLTPAFKSFRQQNLAAGHCNNPPAQSLTCDSLLDASATHGFTSLSTTITDFTFKDGQEGKSVTYHLTQGGSDPGTTYFTFYLLPRNDSWLLNDYRDVYVSQGVTYSLLPGEREQGR